MHKLRTPGGLVKSAQAIEKAGDEFDGYGKRVTRELLKSGANLRACVPPPRGSLDGYQKKGVAGGAIISLSKQRGWES
jgi:hypothetical protein